jgi:nucleoid DNA-binding protein
MPDYLSKSDIAQLLADEGLGGKQQISRMLDGLADLAAEEVGAGNDFQVPGIAKLSWSYRPPKAKGERWRKGDEVTGFGGITSVKDSDSPAQKAHVKLNVKPFGKTSKLRVSKAEMSAFLKSKAGKNVVSRKSKKA